MTDVIVVKIVGRGSNNGVKYWQLGVLDRRREKVNGQSEPSEGEFSNFNADVEVWTSVDSTKWQPTRRFLNK